jgi:peroxidase
MTARNLLHHFLKKSQVTNSRTSKNRSSRNHKTVRCTRLEQLEDRRVMAANIRSYDGTGNNLLNSEWGSTNEQLLRIVPAEYGDSISTPAGQDRANPRTISNTLIAHDEDDVKNDRSLAAMVYAWGQFIDHDLDLTVSATPRESLAISVPQGDPLFDPFNTGTKTIPLTRSQYDTTTGINTTNPRQQVNSITAFLDGSMVYASDEVRALALRSMVGGRMKTSEGNMLPLNTAGLENDNATHQTPDDQLFLAGDVRANENIELTSLHTLFVREHNRIADGLAAEHPDWTDEQLYQQARKIVIAEIQAITFNEFLPSLLGSAAPKDYRGYNPRVNPGIANEFSTAAFRVGHTMLGNDIEFLNNDEEETHEAVGLFDAFFNPNLLTETGIDPILKYLATDLAEEIDVQVVDSVRNQLFGPPGSGGLDLVALNIQRGRDHGLADYNATRVKYGLSPVISFSDITSDPEIQQKLTDLYGTVDNIDLWVGGIAEDHIDGASVGPTFARIIADQFNRIRAGDRFWYENTFRGSELRELQQTTLADVIRRNTTITNLQPEAFYYGSEVSGRVMSDSYRDFWSRRRESGISGVQVNLLDASNQVIATTTSKSGGYYGFYGIENGNYKVQIELPAAARRSTITSQSISIFERMAVENVTLTMPRIGNRWFDRIVDCLSDWVDENFYNGTRGGGRSNMSQFKNVTECYEQPPTTEITKKNIDTPVVATSQTVPQSQETLKLGGNIISRTGSAPRLGMDFTSGFSRKFGGIGG